MIATVVKNARGIMVVVTGIMVVVIDITTIMITVEVIEIQTEDNITLGTSTREGEEVAKVEKEGAEEEDISINKV